MTIFFFFYTYWNFCTPYLPNNASLLWSTFNSCFKFNLFSNQSIPEDSLSVSPSSLFPLSPPSNPSCPTPKVLPSLPLSVQHF